MSPHRMVRIVKRVRDGADARQLGRRLGPQRSAADPATGEAMLAAGFTADDVDRVLWRNPVAFFGQSGAARRCPTAAQAGRDVRRQLDPAGRQLMRLRHADGQRSTSATAPTSTRPRTCRDHRAARQVRGAGAPSWLGADRLGRRAVAGRAGRAGLAADPASGGPAAPGARRARAGGRHPQRLSPTRRSMRRSSSSRCTSPDWTTPERLEYTLDLARMLGRLLPDDAARGSISTLPLAWRDAGPRSADALPAAADRACRRASPSSRGGTGRLVRVAFEPEPGCIVETTAEAAAAGRRRHRVARDLPGPRHLAVRLGGPGGCAGHAAAAGLPVVKVQVSAALAPTGREPGTAAALRGYDEPRFLHQSAQRPPARPPTTSPRRWTPSCPARGGCTSTCRCTPRPQPPLQLHRAMCCGPRWASCRRRDAPAATTSKWRPTPGGCCRRRSARPDRDSWPAASPRSSLARDELCALGLSSEPAGRGPDLAVVREVTR